MGPADEGWRDRVGGKILKTRLFVLSYMPLLWIFAFQCTTWRPAVGYAIAGALVIADGYRLTFGQLRKGAIRCSLSNVRDKSSEVSGYLATYLLPFLSGPPQSWHAGGAYLVYFLIAWVVYVNSDLLFINPALYLLRWRVGEGQLNGRKILILARRMPETGEEFDAVTFAGGVLRTRR
jgi:hypothetical protein